MIKKYSILCACLITISAQASDHRMQRMIAARTGQGRPVEIPGALARRVASSSVAAAPAKAAAPPAEVVSPAAVAAPVVAVVVVPAITVSADVSPKFRVIGGFDHLSSPQGDPSAIRIVLKPGELKAAVEAKMQTLKDAAK